MVYRCKTWLGSKSASGNEWAFAVNVLGLAHVLWDHRGLYGNRMGLLLPYCVFHYLGCLVCGNVIQPQRTILGDDTTRRDDVKDEGIITRNFGDLLSARTEQCGHTAG